MDAQIETLNPARTVAFSPDTTDAVGLYPGSRFAILVDNDQIILKPVKERAALKVEDDSLRSPTGKFAQIRALRGILASELGMVEELQQERRQDKW